MALLFYPHDDDMQAPLLQEKLDTLMEAAESFKAIVLDNANIQKDKDDARQGLTPRDILAAYNWDELAKILKIVRELPEGAPSSKAIKADRLNKLAEVYEVLRGAKMPKLEAVRLALVNEANQLRPSTPGAAA